MLICYCSFAFLCLFVYFFFYLCIDQNSELIWLPIQNVVAIQNLVTYPRYVHPLLIYNSNLDWVFHLQIMQLFSWIC